jgi:hypothetical protein
MVKVIEVVDHAEPSGDSVVEMLRAFHGGSVRASSQSTRSVESSLFLEDVLSWVLLLLVGAAFLLLCWFALQLIQLLLDQYWLYQRRAELERKRNTTRVRVSYLPGEQKNNTEAAPWWWWRLLGRKGAAAAKEQADGFISKKKSE